MTGHIFISHSHQDRPYVSNLVAHLRHSGVFAWYDQHMVAGDPFEADIEDKIDTCKAFVLVMTPSAQESSWVRRETQRARMKRKEIMPLLLDGQMFPDISQLHVETVFGGAMPSAAFVAKLKVLAERPDGPVPPPEFAPQQLFRRSEGPPGDHVRSVSWSNDGHRIASAHADGVGRIWDAETASVIQELRGHKDAVRVVSWAPADKMVATAGPDQIPRVFDGETGVLEHAFNGHRGEILDVSWSPNGARLVSVGTDAAAYVWDVQTGQKVDVFHSHWGGARAVSWSRDGLYLASAGEDRNVNLFDASSGQHVAQLNGHHGFVHGVAWRPDGIYIATASGDHTARLWRVLGQESHALPHENAVWSVAWSPDGLSLATGCGDGIIRIWRPADGGPFVADEIRGHEDRVWSVSWSADGQLLASGSADGSMRVWRVWQPTA